jgi:hypothetical protein
MNQLVADMWPIISLLNLYEVKLMYSTNHISAIAVGFYLGVVPGPNAEGPSLIPESGIQKAK